MRATVKLYYADMTTHVDVPCEGDDDDETLIARAWALARRKGWLTLPMAYQNARVVERR